MATKRGILASEKTPYKNIIRRQPKPNSKTMRYIEDVHQTRFLKNSKSLEEAFPEVAFDWCYKKNCGWGPEDFASSSKVSAWWECPNCDFVWQAKISNRTRQLSECPQCYLGETTDLREFPLALAQFDRKRNVGINPYKLSMKRQVFWKCSVSRDHRWKTTFNRSEGIRCPYCRGQRSSRTNNLLQFPSFAKQFHPTKNGKLKPMDITTGTHKSIWWKCAEARDHVWLAVVKDRIAQDQGCPFCANQRVCRSNCLATRFPKIAQEWHPKRNLPMTPRSVVATSSHRVVWRCRDCAHEWQARVVDRTQKGSGCPACVGKAITKNNCLATLFPQIASEWHKTKNGSLTAKDVSPGSHNKYWFCCKQCAFEWQAQLQSRTRQGNGCPPCGKAKLKLPRKRANAENNLQKCYPKVAKEWHPSRNKQLKPIDVHATTNKKYWFLCKKCNHEWESRVERRTRGGVGCPACN